jgi:hypothetical protein
MLKYLFQANFSDGTFLQQTQDDISKMEPTKSAFYDVLQHDNLESFGLFSEQVPNIYAVDLRDGHFEINGVPFNVQDPSEKIENSPRRLIYFRNVTRMFNPENMEETDVNLVYHIGWQLTDSTGRNFQYTISII